ncbi:MAG: ankyrin repeat domain-containing protein [Gammaproteobacteria bacterium SHHR-1]|uniref:ankyrin repeat domain-containing protein n=1 Tax=Magnetovirga frankeli TaxID=947516 RepID=UPI0012936154|nr:ankyrin repeat domain-containing protein [gamma proteobacterium SS-5]
MRRILALSLLLSLAACGGPSEQPSISLYLALQRGDLNQIERHIAWQADLNAPLPNGLMPLHLVAADGRVAIARLLIKQGAQVNGRDQNGNTPIYHALRQGRTQLAEMLLQKQARLDADAMLWQLVQDEINDRDVVQFLQRQGADINRLRQGKSLLGEAIRRDNLHLSKLLIRAGADVNLAEESGTTPLHWARQVGNDDIIRQLLRQGAKDRP